jgi:hypothetical protein
MVFMNMTELEQMRREWVEVTRKNGFREGITDLLAHQYTKKTHFIFELLQNAEDAGATEVEFRVESHRLVFSHNGNRLFSNENIKSITSIGKSTKQADYTQIGKHGIGFKAVFAYTHTPQIHSGDKHFDIEDVVIPCFLTGDEVPTDLKPEETRIILPFDSDAIPEVRRFRKFVSAETAKADISDALKKLSIRTLLFLRHIEKIRWTLVNGTEGAYSRKSIDPNRISPHYVDVADGNRTESWLVFEQEINVTDDEKDNKCIVEVAFLVENGKVISARDTELVVYFPTDKKTGLSFLIHGPFKTTKARDNIKHDDDANIKILEAAANLAANSLEILRDINLLDVSSYLALPLRAPEDSFFSPVYNQVWKMLRANPLLPAYDGSFIKAQEAKLARGKDLVNLFSSEKLAALFNKEKLIWLDASITESGALADLHTYLVGHKKYSWSEDWEIEPLWGGLLVDADTLAPKLTADFLDKQPLPWLVKFIQHVMRPQSSSAFKRTPFIRLVSGKQVTLPSDKEMTRPAWFAPKNTVGLDLSVFPLVHPELAANEDVREFLEKEGIREIDSMAIVEKSILPKYQDTNSFYNEASYRVDLMRIYKAYSKANDTEKAQLNASLSKNAWLACVHASGNALDKIEWQKPSAPNLFEKTADNETWFEGLEDIDAYFLHSSVVETLNGLVSSLAKTTASLTLNLSAEEHTISLSNEHSIHKWGLKGFNPNATIVGIKSAWADWSQERSKVFWKVLLSAPSKIISGETQSETNRQRLKNATKEIEYTDIGELCRKEAWLPDEAGKWHMPRELRLLDLPDGFEANSMAAKELAKKLGMRLPERERALEIITCGDPNRKMLIEHILSASDAEREKILKLIPQEVQPNPAPSFRDGLKNIGRPQRGGIKHGDKKRSSVSNPVRYQDKLNDRVAEGVEEHNSTLSRITFSPVRDSPSNAEARRFLYEQYHGNCQITGATFQKASRSADDMAENYFEACSLLSYGNANYLNDAGNLLCVSADTMAKFKYASIEFLEDIEDAIKTFNANALSAENISVKIRIAGEECYIQWMQRHFMRLVALYEEA